MEENEPIFEDLLNQERISRLEIKEPGLTSFSAESVVNAFQPEKKEEKSSRRFSRKERRQNEETDGAGKLSLKRTQKKKADTPLPVKEDVLIQLKESTAAWNLTQTETGPSSLFFSSSEKTQEVPIQETVVFSEELTRLQDDLRRKQEQALAKEEIKKEKMVEKANDYIQEIGSEDAARTQILELAPPVSKQEKNVEALAAAADLKETIEEDEIFRSFKEPDLVDEDMPIDPDSSLVDDTDYDLYVDRKRFWVSDYEKVQEYLDRQAAQGFEFVRHEGKRYYFHRIKPRNYYYQMLYFVNEPDQDQWDTWERDGWELIDQSTGRKKKDAGWYIVRNLETMGEYRKTIENEDEKLKFYRKSAASYRSSMFLFFVVMLACAVSLFLQIEFRGYPAGMLLSGIVFGIALILFTFYGVMRRKSVKSARLLKARMRLKDRDPIQEALAEGPSSEEAAGEREESSDGK